MRPLSASEALSPSLRRVRAFLFTAIDAATFFRLAALAVVAESTYVSFRYIAPGEDSLDVASFDPHQLLEPRFLGFTLVGAATLLFFCFFAWYLVLRLRFVLFHCLVFNTRQIRPAWDRYGRHAWRFFKATLLFWLAVLVGVLLIVGAAALVALAVFKLRTEDGKFDPGVFLILFLPTAGFALAVGVAALAASVILHDFMLPHFALDDAGFFAAWRAVRASIRADKERYLSYFILRVFLVVVASVALALAAAIPGMIGFGILGMSATGFDAMLSESTGLVAALRAVLAVLFLVLGAGFGFLLSAALGGPLGVWVRSYAIDFYAGRYRALGERVAPAADATEKPIDRSWPPANG